MNKEKTMDDKADEKWYDTEIAPALKDLAKRCNERGMSFLASVEFQPGDMATTFFLTKDAGVSMQMLKICAMTAPNVDSYVINLKRWAKENNVDAHGSLVLNRFP